MLPPILSSINYEIVKIPSSGQPRRSEMYKQCREVRLQVFCVEQGFPVDIEEDSYDETAEHFLVRLTPEMKPIGTIRAVQPSTTEGILVYKLSRLVVLPEYRKHCIGKLLITTLHEWVIMDAHGRPAQIVLHGQLYVVPFYAKFGYVKEGEPFDEHAVPHQRMVLHLP